MPEINAATTDKCMSKNKLDLHKMPFTGLFIDANIPDSCMSNRRRRRLARVAWPGSPTILKKKSLSSLICWFEKHAESFFFNLYRMPALSRNMEPNTSLRKLSSSVYIIFATLSLRWPAGMNLNCELMLSLLGSWIRLNKVRPDVVRMTTSGATSF